MISIRFFIIDKSLYLFVQRLKIAFISSTMISLFWLNSCWNLRCETICLKLEGITHVNFNFVKDIDLSECMFLRAFKRYFSQALCILFKASFGLFIQFWSNLFKVLNDTHYMIFCGLKNLSFYFCKLFHLLVNLIINFVKANFLFFTFQCNHVSFMPRLSFIHKQFILL